MCFINTDLLQCGLFIFVLINQNEHILNLNLNDRFKIKTNVVQGNISIGCMWSFIYVSGSSEYFPQGSLKFYLIWRYWCTGVQKTEEIKKTGWGDTPAHHVPRCCDGGHGMLSIAWVMSQVPQKSFTTICVCRSCGECGMPFSGSSWTFSGSRWPGQMVWLKLPPLPLQQEIKHRS